MKSSTKVFGIVGLILLLIAVGRAYEETLSPLILRVPVTLQTGANITETFTVHRGGSYDLEVECERTPELMDDLDDALVDGLDVDVRMTSEGQPIQFHSHFGHRRGGGGFYSRVLGTFDGVPRKSYTLTLHVIRYGPGISVRDGKPAGTWDENLLIPEEAHPKLKIEIDPLTYETDAISIPLAVVIGLICVIAPVKFWIRRAWKRPAAPI